MVYLCHYYFLKFNFITGYCVDYLNKFKSIDPLTNNIYTSV